MLSLQQRMLRGCGFCFLSEVRSALLDRQQVEELDRILAEAGRPLCTEAKLKFPVYKTNSMVYAVMDFLAAQLANQ